jgi:hypothetical protein
LGRYPSLITHENSDMLSTFDLLDVSH